MKRVAQFSLALCSLALAFPAATEAKKRDDTVPSLTAQQLRDLESSQVRAIAILVSGGFTREVAADSYPTLLRFSINVVAIRRAIQKWEGSGGKGRF